MIKISNKTLPFCILPVEEHGVEIDYEKISQIVEKMEQTILESSEIGDKNYVLNYNSSEIITRRNTYNIFNIHHPALHSIFQIIMKGLYQFKQYMDLSNDIIYIQAWATLTRKGSKIFPHTHNFKYVGNVSINAEPSTTIYHWKNSQGELFEERIENKNGQFQLTKNANHWSTVWEQESTRITIPFDIVTESCFYNNPNEAMPPIFPIHIE